MNREMDAAFELLRQDTLGVADVLLLLLLLVPEAAPKLVGASCGLLPLCDI